MALFKPVIEFPRDVLLQFLKRIDGLIGSANLLELSNVIFTPENLEALGRGIGQGLKSKAGSVEH